MQSAVNISMLRKKDHHTDVMVLHNACERPGCRGRDISLS